jgi:hypothetical protein
MGEKIEPGPAVDPNKIPDDPVEKVITSLFSSLFL